MAIQGMLLLLTAFYLFCIYNSFVLGKVQIFYHSILNRATISDKNCGALNSRGDCFLEAWTLRENISNFSIKIGHEASLGVNVN